MKLIRENFLVFLCLTLITINMSIAKDAESKINNAKLVGICMQGIVQSMPPTFCWKKGADFGTVPSGCPKGYYRQLALCHKKCAPGYESDGGLLCKEKCKKGYKTKILTCYKNILDWYFRDTYFQKTLTNFSSKVPCPKGKYKSGALCYKDCNVIGMQNCGIGACALSDADCTAEIVSMTIDVVSGLSDLFLFIASFGSSTATKAAKDTATQAFKELGKSKMKKIAKSSVKSFKGKFFKVYAKKGIKRSQATIKLMAKNHLKEKIKRGLKNRVKQGIKDKIKEKAKEVIVDGITNTMVYAVCSEAYAQLKKKKEKKIITVENVVKVIDVFNISNSTKACSQTGKNGALPCIKELCVSASAVDPTGLCTIASAFMHETCDIPSRIPEPSYSMKELKKYIASSPWSAVAKEHKKKNKKKKIKVKKGCVRMFQHANYKGRSRTYCKNAKYMGKKDNDQWSSYVQGPDTRVMFFQHSKFRGDSHYTAKRRIPNLRKINFNDRISSLKVAKKEDRIIFYRHSNYKGTPWMFTKGERLSHLGGDQNDRYSSVWVGKNVRVRARKHKDYRGKHWTIKKSVKRFSRKWNDEISSFKVLAK